MSEIEAQSAVALAEHVRGGDVSAEQVTRVFLARAERFDGVLNSLLHVAKESALEQARAIDAKRKAGTKLGLLAGVPVAIKDSLCVRGMPMTCASRILDGYRPPYDAHVIERLRAEDAVLIGKANMDEFAMGSSSEHSAYGVVRNPWDIERTPGGSSGGSAVATAARLSPVALGSDTGGSVRQPAAFCGVTAIKPTYGRVSRYGLVAFASSLDQVGPFGRDVRDAARVLSVIAGHDGRDATSLNRLSENFEAACGNDVRGLRVAVVRGLDMDGNAPAVNEAFSAALATLRELGCELVEVDLAHLKYAVATYYLVATAEASSNLARFDGMRYGPRVSGSDLVQTYGATRSAGFGREVKRRIMLGTYALSAGYYDAFYLKAQRVRTLIAQDYAKAFAHCDVIATPTAPTSAFKIGEKTADPLAMYLADIYTLPPSLAGIPAISTPAGCDPAGLPIGLQLTGPAFSEAKLVALTHAFESTTGHVKRAPSGYA